MQINIKLVNKIILILSILLIISAGVACLFLNPAQRIIVGIGLALGLLNILGIWFFLFKNSNQTPPSQQ